MAIRPIPRRLLPHQVLYEEYDGTGSWGKKYKNPTLIKHVRVEPTNKRIQRATVSQVDDIICSSLVFIDCATSSPRTVEIKEKSRVTFNGISMTVEMVEVIYAYDGDVPHHLEVYLSS